jgi:site-specific DNA-methyltransferase (adenine-specific)
MFILSKGRPKTFYPLMKENKSAGQTYNIKRPRPYDNHSIRHNRDEIRTHKEKSIRPNIFSYLIGCGNSRTDHPATFPYKLVEDHIVSWTNENDIIIDPFMGSGTVALSAEKLNRKWIGIEISKEYCDIIKQRVCDYTNDSLEF